MTLHAPEGHASETIEHVVELLRDFDSAMLVTHTPEGRLHSRPLALAEVDADGTIWFLTSQTSQKAAEIKYDAAVLITLQSAKRFVSANGDIAFVRDPAKIHDLWKESHKLWFDGENDPDLVLLRFSPVDVEYWDLSGVRGLRYAFKAAKAYLAGETAEKESNSGVHGKVTT